MTLARPSADAAARELFSRASAHWSEVQWLAYAVLALENCLGKSALDTLGLRADEVTRGLGSGLLLVGGEFRPVILSRGPPSEPGVRPSPVIRQLILRDAQKRDILEAACSKAQELLGRRSQAPILKRLQLGTLQKRGDSSKGVDWSIEREFRESISHAFDADWLQAVWGERTFFVCAHVLTLSLHFLDDVTPLLAWCANQDATELPRELHEAIAAHAIHRLDPAPVSRFSSELEASTRAGFEAALQFVEGNHQLAERLIEQSRAFSPQKHPNHHPFTPLLALLLATRDQGDSSQVAAAWLGGRNGDATMKSASRGLRVFLRYRSEPETRLKRINAHQLPCISGTRG
jgi:hypothetical protein